MDTELREAPCGSLQISKVFLDLCFIFEIKFSKPPRLMFYIYIFSKLTLCESCSQKMCLSVVSFSLTFYIVRGIHMHTCIHMHAPGRRDSSLKDARFGS